MRLRYLIFVVIAINGFAQTPPPPEATTAQIEARQGRGYVSARRLPADGGGAVISVNGQTGAVVLTKADLALGNLDNTSDTAKPISTATQTALNAKAATSALAPVATSGSYADLSGKPTLGTAASTASTDYATAAQGALAGTALQPAGNGAALTGLTKSQVGLPNADNTSDANKPVSAATQTALNGKLPTSATTADLTDSSNRRYVTDAQLTIIGNTTNTNTGDQTTVSGNAGTATALQNARTINGTSFNGTANITVTAAGSTLTDPVTFANGGNTGSAATSATTGTMTVNMTTAVITITPTGACTFNASGGVTGQMITFAITTSGATSFTLTWGTNFRKTGTLATGATTARFFAVTFRCINGTIWQEIARTAVQT